MTNSGERAIFLEATPAEIIALLEDEKGVATACKATEGWAKARRFEDLTVLARSLESQCDPTDTTRRGWFETVVDHVEDQLALSSEDDAVDALLALSLEARERSVTVPRDRSLRLRAFASRLGYGQPVDGFLRALEQAGDRAEHQELLACWMHEVVLRGSSLETDARATRMREVLARAGHPLAGLPLSLLPTECEVPSYMPLYGEKGLGRAIETLTSGPMSVRTIPPPADGASVRAQSLDEPAVIERLSLAVRPWAEGSNGKIEAKVFSLFPAVSDAELGRWLVRALPLESTKAAAQMDVSQTGPEGVFGPLFSAASNGGAYSSGRGGAYGRLAAWTSLGALVGAAASADIRAIEERAASSAFLVFSAPGPWFHDVAWDLGVLALRPGGASVAVLAATDTD
ncbi:MAG TPA: DUF6183 family protein [Labilithrix sp.]|nr:DUF6183 family protein [Labilithrix sp.]